MIDRQSLTWKLGTRLALSLIVLTALALAGLVGHTMLIEAQHDHHELVHDVIREFFLDLAWGIPLFIVLVIGVGAWAVRRTMAPLRVAAEVARGIGPDCRHTRLPVEDLPSEVRPLVEATNSALDRLQDAWGVQQRFVAHAAHEMRTPVAVFRAAVERLPPTGERAALLDDVDRLARLIGQLLDLARVQQGDVDNDRIDAAGIARDVAIGLAPLAANRNVTIAVDLPARLMVSGSTAQLTPVLRNLIENAILHAPPASEVRVGIDGTGRLVVEDRGPGVPAEARDLIFERFQRGAWTTTQGSGLGLSIASEAAQRMRALLSVEDNTPRGARFAIRFAPN